jgi:hypothetical protein
VTKGSERWQATLDARMSDLRLDLESRALDIEDWRRDSIQRGLDLTAELRGVVEALFARLEPLRQPLPASTFIERFSAVFDEYCGPDAPALDLVKARSSSWARSARSAAAAFKLRAGLRART